MLALLAPIVAALAVAPPPAGAASELAVPIVVHETAGTDHPAAPVTVGVPLPPAALTADPDLVLRTADGRERPCQTRVLERWPDGSPRWLLADFVVPLARHARTTVHLRPAGPTPPPGRRLFRRAGPTPGVDGAPVSLHLEPTGAVTVWHADAPDTRVTLAPPVIDMDGPRPMHDPVLAVETAGPVRTELLVSGRHADTLTSEVRLAVFADLDAVRVRHTVTNVGALAGAPLTGIRFHLPLTDMAQARTRIDGRDRPLAVSDGPVVVRQEEPHRLRVNDGVSDARADGVLALTTAALRMTAVVPAFWQEYPKGFTVAATGLTVDLLPSPEQPVVLGLGAAKTHEFWIRLAPGSGPAAPPSLETPLGTPAVAVAAPAWTHATAAQVDVLDSSRPAVHAFLDRLEHDARRYVARGRAERWQPGPPGPCADRPPTTPRVGFYGALNWGDWNFPGYHDETKECDAWGNLEYDLGFGLGLAWLSSGDAFYGPLFERTVRHYRDVDVIHADPLHPARVGMNHPHKVGHFDPRARSTVDLGHVWLEGLLLHHRLTGEARSRRAALRMADTLAARVPPAGNPRQFGWPLVALAAAADAFADPTHRDAVGAWARAGMARHPPSVERGDWKMGVLAEGLVAAHRLTADPAVRTWLERYVRDLMANPARADGDPRYALPVGYLASLTTDPSLAAHARHVVDSMPIGTWGKVLAMHARVGFRLLGPLAAGPRASGPTPDRAAPPPGSAAGSPPGSPSPAASSPPAAD